jgi:Phage endonuclease I
MLILILLFVLTFKLKNKMTRKKTYSKQAVAAKYGFRSGLEMDIDAFLKSQGIDGEYEQHIIEYIKPETKHKYHPDFKLPNGIFVETKGRLLLNDKKKHLLIKNQHPELDIRFLFQNANAKFNKNSKTTYSMWAEKHGFKWAEKIIPQEWLDE